LKKIGIIGLWHQGIVGAACFSKVGYKVIAYDRNEERIASLSQGRSTIYEPGLDELLSAELGERRPLFTTDVRLLVRQCQDILVMFDTTVDQNDNLDLGEIFETMKTIAPDLLPDTLLCFTAQMPVGTCDRIREIIEQENSKATFCIAYSPENLRLGQAVDGFLHPALPVIGAPDEATFQRVSSLMAPFCKEWNYVNVRTAEMLKHALNSYIGLTICFGNEIGNICDEVGADGHLIAKVLKLEERIGRKAMMAPGLGFSGGTIARDIQTLRRIGDAQHVDTILLDGVWAANLSQNAFVINTLKKIFGSLSDLPITVLGLTYKANTSTLRRSLSIEIVQALLREGACIRTHDPRADRNELLKYSGINFYEDPYEAIRGCRALVLITAWKEYKELDFARVKSLIGPDPIVFDTAKIWNETDVERFGMRYVCIGAGKKGG
jgi:UDPglucose 6-dehydrogenase